MSHSETKLLSENRKLRSQLAQKVRLPVRKFRILNLADINLEFIGWSTWFKHESYPTT